MTQKLDYKKEYKDLYQPKAAPMRIEVPAMRFIMVDGRGNPNDEGGDYQQAIELLYALSYTIKMSKMSGQTPEGYFDYVVPPLEGLWWMSDDQEMDFTIKEKYCWISMIRQPEFVTQALFDEAVSSLAVKKPELDTSKARLADFREGLCVQIMHIGPYEEEHLSIQKLHDFMETHHLVDDIGGVQEDGSIRRHHEIYLGDPRKVLPSKRKTVLRHPVREI